MIDGAGARRAAFAAGLLLVAAAPRPAPGADLKAFAPVEERITLPLFGRVMVYRPEPIERARGVVLFVSGDGGWNLGVVDMARRVAGRAVVVGLPMPAWRRAAERESGRCWYPAGELEAAAQRIEKLYHLPRYVRPILVGYSSGATVVYGALVQGPAEAFAGAVSLGFCPDAEIARPVCGRDDWRPDYQPDKRESLLPARPGLPPRDDGAPRFTILQGAIDRVCDPGSIERFAAAMPAARVVSLPGVGHGFSVTRRWGAAFDAAIDALLDPAGPWEASPAGEASPTPGPRPSARPDGGADAAPAEMERRLEALGLPLVVHWPVGARQALIFMSGDGGWAELDQGVADGLVSRGVAVIGWNSLRYFWERKSPRGFGADLARVVETLPASVRILAGGYSFGAEVIPVVLDPQLPARPAALSRLSGLVLLAPGPYASFEISPLDWFRSSEAPTRHPVRPALERSGDLPVLCLEPADGGDTGCAAVLRGMLRERLPGGHHFAGDFEALSARIAEFIRQGGALR